MPLLRIEPRENLVFCFERRGDQRASSTFRIWNDSPRLFVAFKVKTTDPLKFRGGPIYGILMPGSYRDVDVTVHGQVEALFNIQHADNVVIKSLRASENDTVESIRILFIERASMVENYELTVAYAMRQRPSNFEIGFIVLLTCLPFWYFAMEILSRIRALVYVITILMVRMSLWMMRSRALDAAEEWINTTLLYLSFCFLAAIREYVVDLCWRWLELIYNAFLALRDSLYLYVFGPQVREQRPRRRYLFRL